MESQENIDYLNKYEQELTSKLLQIASERRCGGEHLYQTDDLEQVWRDVAPHYMVDAIPNIAEFPTVAIAWAGYIGMGLAHLWDKDWALVSSTDNVYAMLRDPRGFDAMDEYIVEDIMGYLPDSETAGRWEDLMRALSQTALSQIRHEQLEPQTPMAFHVYARTVRAMFRVGVSCELFRLGYKWTKA